MKFTKLFLISFTLLLSTIMIVQLGIAQVRTVGVSEGEWFKYGIELDWNYELEESPGDFIFTDFLEGDMITLTIQDVSGTNVTGQFTIQYENGSERILNGSVDLTTGEGDIRNWIISANLIANNPLYETEIDETINQTVSQSYPWGSRQTNQLLYSYNFSSGEDYSSLNLGFYWDQEIGILTELSLEAEMQQNGTLIDGSVSLILTESNQQNIPEFPTIILVLLFILVTLLAIIYEKYTSRNKLAH